MKFLIFEFTLNSKFSKKKWRIHSYNMTKKLHPYVRKGLKIVLWTIGLIFTFLILLIVLIQLPPVQNFAKDKAVTFLQDKIKTPVKLDHIFISFPKEVVIEGLYLEDQSKDTLISAGKIAVDISIFKLISSEIEISSFELKDAVAKISKDKNSVFNFDYIVAAFASNEPKDPNSKSMKISVSKVKLDNVKFNFEDATSKNDIAVKLLHFDTKFNKFDLDNMKFDIPYINLDGVKLMLDQGAVERVAEASVQVADTVSKRPDFDLKLGKIRLSSIDVGYDNVGSKLNTGIKLKELLIKVNKIDINNQLLDFDDFQLHELKGQLLLGKFDQKIKTPDADTTAIKQQGWTVKLNKAEITKTDFKFDDDKKARSARGIDYAHLDLKDFNFKAKNIGYSSEEIKGEIVSLTVKEKSGLTIERLNTEFFYGPKKAYLKDLYLKTPNTLLKDRIEVAYNDISKIGDDLGNMALNASLSNSKIAFSDILIFAPQLSTTNPFASNQNAVLILNTELKGTVNDLSFPYFEISGIGSTRVAASGRITGLPDVEKSYFDITIQDLKSTSKDIYAFLPKGTIPTTIEIPQQIDLKGKFTGAVNNFQTDIVLNSSFGTAKAKGFFDQRQKDREKYNLKVALVNFNIGRLIKNDSLGRISVNADVKGTGLNPKTADATIKGLLAKADFNGYAYKDLKLDGKISKGLFDITAGMTDPNLDFDLTANGKFDGKYPEVKLKLNLDIADLQKLNLHAGPMKLRGEVIADIANADPDMLNGTIGLNRIQILQDKDPIILDSISIVAITTVDTTSLRIRSQFMKADFKGKYKLSQMPIALQNTISHYYDTTKQPKKETADQQLAFNIYIDNDPVIKQLIPALTGLEPIDIKGSYTSVNDSINIIGSIPRLVYGKNTIAGGNILIETKDDAIVYSLNIDEIMNDEFRLPYTSLTGDVKDNTVTYDFHMRDKKKDDLYVIGGNVKQVDGTTEIRLDSDHLLLNYESWVVNPENVIKFGPNGINADQFEISYKGNILKLQSEGTQKNAPLKVDFSNFEIATIFNIIKKEQVLMSGKINGEALVNDLMGKPTFTSDLQIDEFAFLEEPIGTIKVQVESKGPDVLAANIGISGNDNQVDLIGTYGITSGAIDLNLDMNKFQMKSAQGFSVGAITDASGYLSGKFKITGTTDNPSVNGDLNFNDVAMRVTQLNSYFKNIDEKVVVNNQGITFDKFSIYDEKDNDLVVNGKVLTSDFRDYKFDLTVKSQNFRAINSKEKDNDLFYGDLFIDMDLVVKGSIESPVISGDLKINDDTKFTVVLPQSDPGIADREGIVEFVDQENSMLQQTEKMQSAVNSSELLGMDVAVNISIVKEAELSLIIDKGNGDYLKLQGEAELSGGIDPSGKTNLTGKYEFTEGAYEMSFNLIRRKFDIKPGSYIIWNGEPTSANIDITAIYEVETAPIDLLGDQLGATSTAVRNTYKQKIPFQTLLKMKGELLKPEISFDILLPSGNYNVASDIVTASQTKLEQLRQEPSELNKQVFALLLLNRFIGENPFASEGGGASAESFARQSVSKILSQQLNDLAGDLIKGVQLDFDLDSSEDYSSGQMENRTDLNVNLSKQLLNDRLTVTVGSSFGLEGNEHENEEANNIAGDLSAAYSLTSDGRYKVRAYRKNEYQMALQGQVIETGVAFVVTMDYNKFRELFHRSQEEKEILRRDRERKKEQKVREEAKKEKDFKEEKEKKNEE